MSTTPTLADYAERWLRVRAARYRPTTLAGYRSILGRHILPTFGPRGLDTITRREVRAQCEHLIANGLAPNTIRMALTALGALYTDARLDGLVDESPVRGAAERLFAATATSTTKALNAAELGVFLAAARDTHPAIADLFLVMARTGVRLGEALALDVGSLGEGRALHVTRTYHGAGRVGPTKTGRVRRVDLSHHALAILTHRAAEARPPHRWLFSARGWWPYHPGSIQDVCHHVLDAAGLPAHFTPHALRHTYASLLLAAGAPMQYVQQQLGHRTIGVTVDTYGSWLHPRRHDLVDALDAAPAPFPARRLPETHAAGLRPRPPVVRVALRR